MRYIVTATATIMDGTVVRWYRSAEAEDRGSEVLSASRNGVLVHDYLHAIPADWLVAATGAYQSLRLGTDIGRRYAQSLATHRRSLTGPLKPIERTETP